MKVTKENLTHELTDTVIPHLLHSLLSRIYRTTLTRSHLLPNYYMYMKQTYLYTEYLILSFEQEEQNPRYE